MMIHVTDSPYLLQRFRNALTNKNIILVKGYAISYELVNLTYVLKFLMLADLGLITVYSEFVTNYWIAHVNRLTIIWCLSLWMQRKS